MCVLVYRPITAIKWFQLPVQSGSGASSEDVYWGVCCCSRDGYVMCFDISGRLLSATQVSCGVRCLDVICSCSSAMCTSTTDACSVEHTLVLFGGCDDGCVRAWSLNESQQLVEVTCVTRANHTSNMVSVPTHSVPPVITALAVSKNMFTNGQVIDADASGHGLLTAGQDGSIRAWTITIS